MSTLVAVTWQQHEQQQQQRHAQSSKWATAVLQQALTN
jgi:hypothetical protein